MEPCGSAAVIWKFYKKTNICVTGKLDIPVKIEIVCDQKKTINFHHTLLCHIYGVCNPFFLIPPLGFLTRRFVLYVPFLTTVTICRLAAATVELTIINKHTTERIKLLNS